MNYDFLVSLPWRLASFAGLLVGGIALACGVTDYSMILLRMSIAFAAFYIIGLAASTALKSVAGVYSVRNPDQTKKNTSRKSSDNPAAGSDDFSDPSGALGS